MDADHKGLALDAKVLASRMTDAAYKDEPEVFAQYARELDIKVSEIMALVDLELPPDIEPEPQQDDREAVARGMLDEYHSLTVKLKIRESVLARLEARLGLVHELTNTARDQRNETYSERETLVWTILELMGVESAP